LLRLTPDARKTCEVAHKGTAHAEGNTVQGSKFNNRSDGAVSGRPSPCFFPPAGTRASSGVASRQALARRRRRPRGTGCSHSSFSVSAFSYSSPYGSGSGGRAGSGGGSGNGGGLAVGVGVGDITGAVAGPSTHRSLAERQQTLHLLRTLRALGYTLAGAAQELNARGIRNRRGRDWSHQFVSMLLLRHPTE
jgi:hypothetical protein